MKSNLITNSRANSFLTCPRHHRYQYVDGLFPVETSEALSFGTLMHKALEAWWNEYMKHNHIAAYSAAHDALQGEEDPFLLARASVLMSAYDARWSDSMHEFEVLGVEQEFRFKPKRYQGNDSERVQVPSPVQYGGKIDAVVRKVSDGTLWGVEHKTSGADLSPGSSYWTRLRMDSQCSLYLDGIEALYNERPAGIIYDVIEKPDIRPLKATPIDQRKYTKATKDQPSRLYANQREADETPDEFERRIVDFVAQDPNRFLQRAEVIRLDSEVEAAREDIGGVSRLIQFAESTGYHPRATGACKRYGRDCSYLSLCEGTASPTDEHLYQIGKIHPELT